MIMIAKIAAINNNNVSIVPMTTMMLVVESRVNLLTCGEHSELRLWI